jgi:DGQHR domain-containing protein
LRLPALEIRQGDRKIYAFGVDGKQLHDFAAVSRVHRDEGELGGYQRPEVINHVKAIRRYLESDGAILPNAIVVAFDERVKFEPVGRKSRGSTEARHGYLKVPYLPEMQDAAKPAWVVDGQQRSAAIRDADIEDFHVAAVGFIAQSEEEQRSQFILVNSTKPLPKGLIHELLPDTQGQLPPAYLRRKLPAYLMIRLNSDIDSPFHRLIDTPTTATGYIKDNSVLKMIENSLFEGALYQYRDSSTGMGDDEAMLLHLKKFWGAVEEQWPIEWTLPPRKSRLTHGVGIQSLGYVMDAVTDGIPAAEIPGLELKGMLSKLDLVAAWTEGTWQLSPGETRRWNGLQNTPQDVRLLTNLLLRSIRTTGG